MLQGIWHKGASSKIAIEPTRTSVHDGDVRVRRRLHNRRGCRRAALSNAQAGATRPGQIEPTGTVAGTAGIQQDQRLPAFCPAVPLSRAPQGGEGRERDQLFDPARPPLPMRGGRSRSLSSKVYLAGHSNVPKLLRYSTPRGQRNRYAPTA